MGSKVLGPLQAASATFSVLLNQEPTVHTADGLALDSRGEDGALGGCLMIEAEFHNLRALLEASEAADASTDVWLLPPPVVQARLRASDPPRSHLDSVCTLAQAWIRAETEAKLSRNS